ncbi:hypothetical protein E3G68_005199 [Mycobacteroides abscessus]|uniref:GH39 family glycosyl hydrolase n=1 Tax=Mycobacteroides abscessus TaxID=36809 RepID=UPI00187866AC|nr:hypothetical protein [Mycobacteroides abscessus]
MLNTTPSPLLRAKLAASSVAFAVLAGAATGQPAPTTLTTQAGGPAQRHVAVQLVAQISDSSPSVGVADSNLYNLSQDELVDRLNQMKTLGVTDLRVAVPWVYIQPTSATSYDWSKMDNVVDTAAAMGFSITGAISGNPTWDGTPLAGAPNPTAYANFASAVASRYGAKISAYEVWNEPNGVIFFAPVSAAKYTEVLKAAYTAIKAVNPAAVVLAGALGATSNVSGISVSPQKFLEQMYAAGAAGYFDALSYHPYGTTLPFSAGAAVTNSALQQIQALYSIMVANGDGGKKIWGTEYGNATTPGIGVTTAEQAQFLQDFVTAWTKLPFTGPAFVYTVQDIETGMLNAEANFGLFNSDGTPKPAAALLAKLIAELDTNGTLPDYSAPTMSLARDAYLQVASIAFGLVNTGLIIPNAIVAAVYNVMPAPARRAFTALANIVTRGVAAVVTAMAPMAQAGIQALINIGSAMSGPKATAKPALAQQDTAATTAAQQDTAATTAAQQDTAATTAAQPVRHSLLAQNLHDTQLTVQGVAQRIESTLKSAVHDTELTLHRLSAEAPASDGPTTVKTKASAPPESIDSVNTSEPTTSAKTGQSSAPKATSSTSNPTTTDDTKVAKIAGSATKPDSAATKPGSAASATSDSGQAGTSTGTRPKSGPKHRKQSPGSSTASAAPSAAGGADAGKDDSKGAGPRHARTESPKPQADS